MRRQCAKCPWRKSTDPHDIPNGYSVKKHKALADTIATPGALSPGVPIRMMACHETHSQACVGWLAHQLGPGNNLTLRLLVIQGRVDARFKLVGAQHERFEDTLPKRKKKKPGIIKQAIEHARERSEVEEERRAVKPKRSKKR